MDRFRPKAENGGAVVPSNSISHYNTKLKFQKRVQPTFDCISIQIVEEKIHKLHRTRKKKIDNGRKRIFNIYIKIIKIYLIIYSKFDKLLKQKKINKVEKYTSWSLYVFKFSDYYYIYIIKVYSIYLVYCYIKIFSFMLLWFWWDREREAFVLFHFSKPYFDLSNIILGWNK